MSYHLTPPTRSDYQTLQDWFDTPQALQAWAGPDVRLTPSLDDFIQQLQMPGIRSHALKSAATPLLGFGQCYSRHGLHHLARLTISPLQRGKGLVHHLMDALIEQAYQHQPANGVSLFVHQDNSAAIHSYRRYGFVPAPYPGDLPDNYGATLYMVLLRQQ
ncbi:GNAT family N-acetyltransferase [Aestuariibacter halophilus]|uniref:GNAT family N-acetyltransferase n=1 Tax=Fluctibacter halophilus TaxID=226011 RepID=A0ABS8GBV4_9ALTE|nr:N-acetyltransferase [Aestuariibacter halophilus]MCC2617883.1 GNAT family N-acetyltransferase [Aestuariibacter halophilus]